MSGAGARPCDNPAPVLQRLSRFQRCSVQVPGVCVCARVCACVRASCRFVQRCSVQVPGVEARETACTLAHTRTNLELVTCTLQRLRTATLPALQCASGLSRWKRCRVQVPSSRCVRVCACVRVCVRVCACVCIYVCVYALRVSVCNSRHQVSFHCNTLQLTATRCNALQHAATHCLLPKSTTPRSSPTI